MGAFDFSNLPQLLLLGLFAVLAAACLVLRIRIGMLEGALLRGEKDAETAQSAVTRLSKLAVYAGIGAAVSIALCIALGAVNSL